MSRGLSFIALASVLLFGSAVSGRAQFARLPQQDGVSQYPQYSNNQSPDNSYGPSAPNGTIPDPAADGQHGAARISVVQGDVNVRRGDTSELVAAAINAPLVAQDRLQTSAGSRAEMELDSANLIRLSPDTDVGLAGLEYRRFQVQVGAGTILYRVVRPSESQGEVDTPSIALRALEAGAYRISVLPDGTTQIDVRAGSAEIFGPRGSQRIEAGHSVLVRGNPADPEFQEVAPTMRDQFDDWSEMRDREILSSQSYQYVSPDVSGAEDLDANGTWVPSQYGQVWTPRSVGPDWAPYSYGQWNWEPYYGWTWVDYAPWGWAPYHYGRWFWNGGHGWCWWPGARLSAHFWSPALVGFFGWGNGVLGWAALAPYETFHPWWGRRGFGGYNSYGPGGFYGLRNAAVWSAYRNAGFRGGAIYAGYNSFGGPHGRFGFATREQLGSASFIHGQVPVGPNRAGYLFTNRQAIPNGRLASVPNRQFFQRPGVTGWQRGAIVAGQNRPAANRSYGQSGGTIGANRPSPSGGAVAGWQRFGDPGSGNGYRQGFTASGGESGWHQFGRPQQQIRLTPSYGQPYSSGVTGSYRRPAPTMPQGRGSGGYSSGYSGTGGSYGSYRSSPYNGSPAPRAAAPSQGYYSAPRSHSSEPSRGGNAPSHGGGGHYSSSGGHGR